MSNSAGANSLLATYGRQPFLWRFFRRRSAPGALISGDIVSFLFGSVWSDETLADTSVSVGQGHTRGTGHLLIRTAGQTIEAQVLTPLILRQEVRDLDVDLAGEEVALRGWPGASKPAIWFLGRARILAGVVRFEVERVQVGALGLVASCHFSAEQIVNDQRLTVGVHESSTLTVDGAFEGRYPWNSVVATTLPSAPPEPTLRNFLAECARRFPGSVAVVVFEDCSLPEGPTDWARRYGDLLPRLLRALVGHGFATADRIQTAGAPKMRVRPAFAWAALLDAYENPKREDNGLRRVFRQLQSN